MYLTVIVVADFTADHAGHQFLLVGILDHLGADKGAVHQHCGSVAHGEDLSHTVRDVN